MINNLKNSIDYKDYSILKLKLEYSKTGVLRLKTISGQHWRKHLVLVTIKRGLYFINFL